MTELLFRDDGYLRSCTARVIAAGARGITLDRTVFYSTGGGQPGDVGVLRLSSGQEIAIVDTVKGEGPDEVIHVPAPGSTLPDPGAELVAEIDWERRYRLMRMHTCLHLLCSIVPGAVTGGQVSDGRGRLDFDVPGSSLDKETLADRLNEIVRATLSRPRDPAALVRDVADMRDRIARHAPPKSVWDFKHLPGGLFDIDFVAQYLALRHAATRPDILHPHPAEVLRRSADAGLIARADADRLRVARTLMSDVQSLLRLTLDGDESAFDESKAPEGQRRLLALTEGASDLAALRRRIETDAAQARAIYRRIVEEPARAAGWKPRSE